MLHTVHIIDGVYHSLEKWMMYHEVYAQNAFRTINFNGVMKKGLIDC